MTSINHPNNLCLVTLHFPSFTSCHCPDHVPPRELDKKFDKILNLKITSTNNPINILTNLCTGLETFLGFNSESKGYDGTGIVYSDLDRLCDAVMGFLSGVLGAVKNENEVTTYDNYMTKKLNEVLDTLTKNIGSGRAGLAASVRAVKEWLEGYGKSVNQKCEDVKTPLILIRNDINNVEQKFQEQKNKTLRDQHKAWKHILELYLGHADVAEKAQDKLDSQLIRKLETPVTAIKDAVKLLEESARNKKLAEELKAVDEELLRQRRSIENRMAQEFRNLRENLTALTEMKDEKFARLKNVVKEAKVEANKLISEYKGTYNNEIDRLFKEVTIALNDITKKSGPERKCKLNELFGQIKKKVSNIGIEIGSSNVELAEWKVAAGNVLENAMRTCEDVVEKLNITSNNDLKTPLHRVKLKATELNDAYQGANNKLQQVAQKAEAAFKQLGTLHTDVKEKVPKGLDDFNNGAVEWNVNGQIVALTSSITSNVEGYMKELSATFTDAAASASWSGNLRPGVTKLVGALQNGNLGTELKILGGVLQQANSKAHNNINDALYNLEITLSHFKQAMVHWGELPSEFSSHDILKDPKGAFSTQAIADNFKTNLGPLCPRRPKSVDEFDRPIRPRGK
ncbi:hypothetical protein, conserved [Babesia bigemina]|uniref:Uncharacterized protein n=1 Tax=Babesia bigemina TaxID=5866 RepID=A0A061BQA4_BABBI|nr:hypothetical protein, conserved [Babesia bigemina]CDR71652.1 hypothetical protein, conserved [Babesia bigemina]|eukprot:XP_012770599.1 hypothetical protein, conserved [Babesia bigemina]